MLHDKQKLKVLIAYNLPPSLDVADDPDLISEAAVMDEVTAVQSALEKKGHRTALLPIHNLEDILPRLRDAQVDVIFNLCEGFRGDARHEAHIAGIWELAKIPYTGNPPLTLSLAQNKVLSKYLFMSNGIPTPAFEVYESVPTHCALNFPVIAKPSHEDASLGITQHSVAKNMADLKAIVARLLEKYRQPILVEELIDGREFNISVIGNHPPKVLPISEIDYSRIDANHYRIAGYEAKWLPEHPMYQQTPVVCPAALSKDLQNKLEDVALRVFHCLLGRDYGRIDIRFDFREQIYVLEFNPNPDISPDAGLARSVRIAGVQYEDFIERLVWDAYKRNQNGCDS
jgi:D-alanine-D-alanine ligase